MGELDIRLMLRQLRHEPDPMAERLMEMYREWWREGSLRAVKSDLAELIAMDRGSAGNDHGGQHGIEQ